MRTSPEVVVWGRLPELSRFACGQWHWRVARDRPELEDLARQAPGEGLAPRPVVLIAPAGPEGAAALLALLERLVAKCADLAAFVVCPHDEAGAAGAELAALALARGAKDVHLALADPARDATLLAHRLERFVQSLALPEASLAQLTRLWWPSLAQCPVAVVLTDAQGAIARCNPAFEALVGRRTAELTGHTCQSLMHEDDLPCCIRAFAAAISQGQPFLKLEKRMRHASGQAREVDNLVAFLRDGRGELVATVQVMSDARAYRDLETRMVQAEKMQAMGRMAAGFAHDFNNLLTVVASHSALLSEEDLDREATALSLKALNTAIDRGSDLTRKLMAFGSQAPSCSTPSRPPASSPRFSKACSDPTLPWPSSSRPPTVPSTCGLTAVPGSRCS